MTRLERGQTIDVMDGRDGGGVPVTVFVTGSDGWAELLDVQTDDGRQGIIARKGDGNWYWLRELDPKPEVA
jgi:hypothetical protein